MSKVYLAGYQGRDPQHLKAIAERLGAQVVDIRFMPRSRDFRWNQNALKNTLGGPGGLYVYCKSFGNRNYKGGPIDLVDFEQGEQQIKALAGDVILLCVCKDGQTCHRHHIGERLAAMGYDVHELEWNGSGAQGGSAPRTSFTGWRSSKYDVKAEFRWTDIGEHISLVLFGGVLQGNHGTDEQAAIDHAKEIERMLDTGWEQRNGGGWFKQAPMF